MRLFQLNLKARNRISTSKRRQEKSLFRLAVWKAWSWFFCCINNSTLCSLLSFGSGILLSWKLWKFVVTEEEIITCGFCPSSFPVLSFLSLNCMGKLRSRPASLRHTNTRWASTAFVFCSCNVITFPTQFIIIFPFKLVDINVDGSLGSDPSEVLSLGCPLCGKRRCWPASLPACFMVIHHPRPFN